MQGHWLQKQSLNMILLSDQCNFKIKATQWRWMMKQLRASGCLFKRNSSESEGLDYISAAHEVATQDTKIASLINAVWRDIRGRWLRISPTMRIWPLSVKKVRRFWSSKSICVKVFTVLLLLLVAVRGNRRCKAHSSSRISTWHRLCIPYFGTSSGNESLIPLVKHSPGWHHGRESLPRPLLPFTHILSVEIAQYSVTYSRVISRMLAY